MKNKNEPAMQGVSKSLFKRFKKINWRKIVFKCVFPIIEIIGVIIEIVQFFSGK